MDTGLYITAQAGAPQAGQAWVSFVPLIAMFAIFYFLLIRPQIRKQRTHDNLVKALRPKDKVVMNNGLYGTVVKVMDQDIILEVADKVHLKFQRSAVGTVRHHDAESED